MNRTQKTALCIAALLVVLCLAAPPYSEITLLDSGVAKVRFLGYGLMVYPPEPELTNGVQIDTKRLLMQIAGILAVCGTILLVSRN